MTRSAVRTRLAALWLGLAVVATVVIGGLSAPQGAAAAGDTMRIEPATSVVSKDATVKLRVIQNSTIATSGAQATITFDPTLVQLVSVTKGGDYAAAPVFAGVTPDTIGAANTNGSIAGIGAAFLPPGSVAPGDREFLVVEFKAVGCGKATIGLPVGPADAALLDGRSATYGKSLAITASGATLTICDTMRIDPPSSAISKAGTVKVSVKQNATVKTSGARATVTFDTALLQLVSVAKGTGYATAPVFTGVTAESIAAANASGSLTGVAASFQSPAAVPAGDAEFLVLEFRAVGCGTATLGLPAGAADAGLLDGRPATYGQPLPVTGSGATVTICNTMRISPAATAVSKDATVKVAVVHNAEVPVSGAQATITFNPGLLKLVSVTKGTDYANAPVFAGVTPEAITAANTSGSIAGIAAAFLPPGAVAPGDREFLVAEFKAIGCGTSVIGLPSGPSDAGLLDGQPDTYGAQIPVTPIGGTVVICQAPKPTPTPRPTAAPTPTPTPTPVPTPVPTAAPPAYVPPPYVPPPSGDVAAETYAPGESPDTGSQPPAAGELPPSSSGPDSLRNTGADQWLDRNVSTVALVGGGVVAVTVVLGFVLLLAALIGAAIAALFIARPKGTRRPK